MKKFVLLSAIAISTFALSACSNTVNKGSFKNLSYGKPLNAEEANDRKDEIVFIQSTHHLNQKQAGSQ